ncbi:MAG TPA: Fic family protein [Candidatus Eisenbacteria bacterium]|nr:Fic family protein [Candidatus Eisenbacteria bacterium]
MSPNLIWKLSSADRTVGRLGGVGVSQLSPTLLLRPLARREAVLSSRIEGTATTLEQLTLFEARAGGPAPPDAVEVFNYHQALQHGLDPHRAVPMSLRLIRELHRILMHDVPRSDPTPGEFRREQNFIGVPGRPLEARFVPPPVPQMHACLDDFEKFLHASNTIPPLIRLAMIHYQFEAIHPFFDGNGRVGRLLLSLLLCEYQILPTPLLHLSAFFEANRERYYDALRRVSTHNDWEGWFDYFLDAVVAESQATMDRIHRINALRDTYHDQLRSAKQTALTARAVDEFFVLPITTATAIAKSLGITYRGAQKILGRLQRLGMVRLMSKERRRGRLYWAPDVLKAFEKG